MSTRVIGKVLIAFLLVSLLLCISTCGGKKTPTIQELQAPSTSNDQLQLTNNDLADVLADIDSQPMPAAVDERVWTEITAELKRVLLANGVSAASHPPEGTLNRINDLALVEDSGSYLLQWSYVNVGDYDQNSEVNVSDLTPVGLYFGVQQGDPNWEQASIADGDGNGVVNISDITPIGQNWQSSVKGYLIEGAIHPYKGWNEIDQFEYVRDPEQQGSQLLVYHLDSKDYEYYRVVPVDANASSGTASAYIPELSIEHTVSQEDSGLNKALTCEIIAGGHDGTVEFEHEIGGKKLSISIIDSKTKLPISDVMLVVHYDDENHDGLIWALHETMAYVPIIAYFNTTDSFTKESSSFGRRTASVDFGFAISQGIAGIDVLLGISETSKNEGEPADLVITNSVRIVDKLVELGGLGWRDDLLMPKDELVTWLTWDIENRAVGSIVFVGAGGLLGALGGPPGVGIGATVGYAAANWLGYGMGGADVYSMFHAGQFTYPDGYLYTVVSGTGTKSLLSGSLQTPAIAWGGAAPPVVAGVTGGNLYYIIPVEPNEILVRSNSSGLRYDFDGVETLTPEELPWTEFNLTGTPGGSVGFLMEYHYYWFSDTETSYPYYPVLKLTPVMLDGSSPLEERVSGPVTIDHGTLLQGVVEPNYWSTINFLNDLIYIGYRYTTQDESSDYSLEFSTFFTPPGSNARPVAKLTAGPAAGIAPLPVQLSASESLDPDGSIQDYEWDLDGDGDFNEAGQEAGARMQDYVEYTYITPQVYQPAVRVTDNLAEQDMGQCTLIVSAETSDPNMGEWRTYVIDPESPSGAQPSLIILNGNPAVAYYFLDSFDLKIALSAVAAPLSPDDWGCHTVYSHGNTGIWPSLAVLNGDPIITFSTDYEGLSILLFAQSITSAPKGDTDWQVHVVDGDGGPDSSLADVNGKPAVLYYRKTLGHDPKLWYAMASTSTPTSSEDWSKHVIYHDTASFPSLCAVKEKVVAGWKGWSGNLLVAVSNSGIPAAGDWVEDGVASTGYYASLSEVDGQFAASSLNVPSQKLMYSAADSDISDWPCNWESHVVCSGGRYSSLVFLENIPAISHCAYGGLYYSLGTCSNPSSSEDWLTYVVDDGVFSQCEIVALSNGSPAIAYLDRADEEIKFAIMQYE